MNGETRRSMFFADEKGPGVMERPAAMLTSLAKISEEVAATLRESSEGPAA